MRLASTPLTHGFRRIASPPPHPPDPAGLTASSLHPWKIGAAAALSTDLPGISRWLRDTVRDSLSRTIVHPASLSVELTDGGTTAATGQTDAAEGETDRRDATATPGARGEGVRVAEAPTLMMGESGLLKLSLLEARDLPGSDLDPYCAVQLLMRPLGGAASTIGTAGADGDAGGSGAGSTDVSVICERVKTATAKGSNPDWNESFAILVRDFSNQNVR